MIERLLRRALDDLEAARGLAARRGQEIAKDIDETIAELRAVIARAKEEGL